MSEPNLKEISKIRETLLRLNLINEENVEVFSKNTRDNNNLTVYKDNNTKIVFIDEYYVGDEEYENGEYRNQIIPSMKSQSGSLEDTIDNERRYKKYRQFVVNKNICDYGCGEGNFLRLSKQSAKSVLGVELQKNFNDAMNAEGIKCFTKFNKITEPIDTCFMFHCLEHLPDPIFTLKEIYQKLKPDGEGKIVIEVPHARDFLLDQLQWKSFKNFTLWSQHLVLHTRHSLQSFLLDSGFKNVHIEGVQRYNIANHLNWLMNNKPGGHENPLSIIETESLKNSYSEALSRIDANDTLVAIATT